MEQGGGLVPFGWLVTQAPTFTLFGDGTVIFRPQQDVEVGSSPEDGLARFLMGELTEESVQALLTYALGTGRLANARASYEDPTLIDASTTVFVLNAAGDEKVVSVYALSESAQPGPDTADRQGFAMLANLLGNFQQEVDNGTVSDVSLYDPELYRAVLFDGMGEPVSEPVAWPWDDVSLDDFQAAEEFGPRSAILTRDQVALLTEVPSGGRSDIWVEAPDGYLVSFAVRPLLPDEAVAGES